MSKSIYLLILTLLLTTQSFAQSIEQKTDSILQLIENETVDTAKVLLLYKLAGLYSGHDPEKNLELLHQTLSFSKKIKFDRLTTSTYLKISKLHRILASPSDSLLLYVQLLEKHAQSTGNFKYIIKAHANYGLYYKYLGQYDKSIASYIKALELSRKHNEPKEEQAVFISNIWQTLQ